MEVPPNVNHFVDCAETIKLETIKEEIEDIENVEDPLSVKQNVTFDILSLLMIVLVVVLIEIRWM